MSRSLSGSPSVTYLQSKITVESVTQACAVTDWETLGLRLCPRARKYDGIECDGGGWSLKASGEIIIILIFISAFSLPKSTCQRKDQR